MYRLWKILLFNMSRPETFRMTLVCHYKSRKSCCFWVSEITTSDRRLSGTDC